MPTDGRLPGLPCDLDRAAAARLAGSLRPCRAPALPLPITPEEWLRDLARSIDRMTWAA